MKRKIYSTPHRTCTVKTRLTEEEQKEFEETCTALSISQSEYLRQAIFYGKVETTIRVTANSEELLDAVSALIVQYGKIGGNLKQIARHLNVCVAGYQELALFAAAGRHFKAKGLTKLPQRERLQEKNERLISEKNGLYEELREKRAKTGELQSMKANFDAMLRRERQAHKELDVFL